ncbi:IS30 family transposase [Pseudarthrobacter defluvii]|uniref:IS30 family transposase n=1 Tax=Pseudarthrobacter defluvii TaxID=410837 RepID=UPI00277D6F48|nr:IS30 family transposase [Pseudarthrobacter defluvii]MDQ0769311.1 IS30 family transposase [Pseudarthrobacter defluvii]
MYLSSSSAAGIRFLASVKHGHGLKPSARHAGIDKEVGYRLLREEYLRLRRNGKTPSETTAELGFTTSRLAAWEGDVGQVNDRHHLRVNIDEEASFWAAFDRGKSLGEAAKASGVSRSTASRWMHRRFDQLRQSKVTVRRCQDQLRLTDRLRLTFERDRLSRLSKERNAATAAQHAAVLSSGRYANQMLGAVLSEAQHRRAARAEKYWQLMRNGVSNAEACRLLGMHRRTGTQLRKASNFQIPAITAPAVTAGRYLDARERLQIADLLRLGHSMRRIAAELGRHASTIKRELDRHRDAQGLYLPHTADHDARLQRARPKVHKLVANTRLRTLVQRKVNRFWSPDEICGWMKKTYPDDQTMRLCPETIYRALLLREDHGLHQRYAAKLRTGGRVRKTRWRTRTGQGSRIRNMTMIDQRPEEVETRLEAGHWESQCFCQAA